MTTTINLPRVKRHGLGDQLEAVTPKVLWGFKPAKQVKEIIKAKAVSKQSEFIRIAKSQKSSFKVNVSSNLLYFEGVRKRVSEKARRAALDSSAKFVRKTFREVTTPVIDQEEYEPVRPIPIAEVPRSPRDKRFLSLGDAASFKSRLAMHTKFVHLSKMKNNNRISSKERRDRLHESFKEEWLPPRGFTGFSKLYTEDPIVETTNIMSAMIEVIERQKLEALLVIREVEAIERGMEPNSDRMVTEGFDIGLDPEVLKRIDSGVTVNHRVHLESLMPSMPSLGVAGDKLKDYIWENREVGALIVAALGAMYMVSQVDNKIINFLVVFAELVALAFLFESKVGPIVSKLLETANNARKMKTEMGSAEIFANSVDAIGALLVSGLLVYSGYKDLAKRPDAFMRTIGIASAFKGGFTNGIDWLMNTIRKFILWASGEEKIKEFPIFADKYPQFSVVQKDINDFCDHMVKNPVFNYACGQKAYRLNVSITELISEMPKTNEYNAYRNEAHMLQQKLGKILNCLASENLTKGVRRKPFTMWISGGTSVGKSSSLRRFITDIFARIATDEQWADYKENQSDAMYVYAYEKEFWDAYHNQFFCVMDEAGLMKEIPGGTNDGFMALIRMANIFDFPLDMADLAKKGKTDFTSLFLILTSNRKNVDNVNSLYYPKAYVSRMDLAVHQYIKVEYAKEASLASGDPFKRQLDPLKYPLAPLGSRLMMTGIEYVIVDLETGLPKSEPFSYEQLLDLVENMWNKAQAVNDVMLESYKVDIVAGDKLRAERKYLGPERLKMRKDFVERSFKGTDVEIKDHVAVAPVKMLSTVPEAWPGDLPSYNRFVKRYPVPACNQALWPVYTDYFVFPNDNWPGPLSSYEAFQRDHPKEAEARSKWPAYRAKYIVTAEEDAEDVAMVTMEELDAPTPEPVDMELEMAAVSMSDGEWRVLELETGYTKDQVNNMGPLEQFFALEYCRVRCEARVGRNWTPPRVDGTRYDLRSYFILRLAPDEPRLLEGPQQFPYDLDHKLFPNCYWPGSIGTFLTWASSLDAIQIGNDHSWDPHLWAPFWDEYIPGLASEAELALGELCGPMDLEMMSIPGASWLVSVFEGMVSSAVNTRVASQLLHTAEAMAPTTARDVAKHWFFDEKDPQYDVSGIRLASKLPKWYKSGAALHSGLAPEAFMVFCEEFKTPIPEDVKPYQWLAQKYYEDTMKDEACTVDELARSWWAGMSNTKCAAVVAAGWLSLLVLL